jgi:hypothetical protein
MLVLETATCDQFLRALLPTAPYFTGDTWYYRGQADATWRLVPSLFRKKSWERFGTLAVQFTAGPDGLVANPVAEIKAIEEDLLQRLAAAMGRMGIVGDLGNNRFVRAFGQHLGLPTRLLDWSRAALTAAYFAAADAIYKNGDGRPPLGRRWTRELARAARPWAPPLGRRWTRELARAARPWAPPMWLALGCSAVQGNGVPESR